MKIIQKVSLALTAICLTSCLMGKTNTVERTVDYTKYISAEEIKKNLDSYIDLNSYNQKILTELFGTPEIIKDGTTTKLKYTNYTFFLDANDKLQGYAYQRENPMQYNTCSQPLLISADFPTHRDPNKGNFCVYSKLNDLTLHTIVYSSKRTNPKHTTLSYVLVGKYNPKLYNIKAYDQSFMNYHDQNLNPKLFQDFTEEHRQIKIDGQDCLLYMAKAKDYKTKKKGKYPYLIMENYHLQCHNFKNQPNVYLQLMYSNRYPPEGEPVDTYNETLQVFKSVKFNNL